MQGILKMSQKERDRLKIIEQICSGMIIVQDASDIMRISERQTYRLLNRYRTEGDIGLIHRLCGHPSNRGYSE